MDTFPDLGSLSDQELKDLIQQLTEEEVDISYKRRILHGKIDILRAELVNRLRKKHEGGEDVISGADVQRLTDPEVEATLHMRMADDRWLAFMRPANRPFLSTVTTMSSRPIHSISGILRRSSRRFATAVSMRAGPATTRGSSSRRSAAPAPGWRASRPTTWSPTTTTSPWSRPWPPARRPRPSSAE